MFGDSPPPQNEQTVFRPRSPYAAAKVYAYWMVRNYREAYDLYGANGILHNHESERRGPTFVTRKISRAVAAIVAGKQDLLYLGNLAAMRDWGHAKDYVKAMWLMLQQEQADDFVIATGETHSVREFAARAFAHVGLDWFPHVRIDPSYYRPTEVEHLHGDPQKAQEQLGWTCAVGFEELVVRMVEHDLGEHGLGIDQARAVVAERFASGVQRGSDEEIDLDAEAERVPPRAEERKNHV
jgi:GDPmannose 4,6-dehydratase